MTLILRGKFYASLGFEAGAEKHALILPIVIHTTRAVVGIHVEIFLMPAFAAISLS